MWSEEPISMRGKAVNYGNAPETGWQILFDYRA